MNSDLEQITVSFMTAVYKRLKKDTRNFTKLVVRDPIDFLDFELEIDRNLKSLIEIVKSGTYLPQRVYIHHIAKSKGINREKVFFDINDSLIYRYCVEKLEKELISITRVENIRGGFQISPREKPTDGDFYERWFKDWIAHNKAVKDGLETKKFLVSTDISSYFENVGILKLKDHLRSDIDKKTKILNLLFYFLENNVLRNDYEVNSLRGLPQEDIDCSRLLAYYFLHPHDQEMLKMCKKLSCDYFRWVDDMTFLVNTETEGKTVLKHLTTSLRKLGLTASIEKTEIFDKRRAYEELFIMENQNIDKLEAALLKKLKNNKSLGDILKKIKMYYKQLIKLKKNEKKGYIKILKRFYSLFTYARDDFLLEFIVDHIRLYPSLTDDKITKYLVAVQGSKKFNAALNEIINYLYSSENLYEYSECQLLESFLFVNLENINRSVLNRITKLTEDILYKNEGLPLSDYARALSCLLYFRFRRKDIEVLCNYYLKSDEKDFLFKKYLIFVALTTETRSLRESVLRQAKMEQNQSINRFVNVIEYASKYKNSVLLKRFLERNKVYLYSRDQDKFTIVQQYKPVRSEIFGLLLKIYS